MSEYLFVIVIMLGILLIMFLAYLLISTCLDCDKYNNDQDDISFTEKVVLCDHNLIDSFQRSQLLIPGEELCAQFIPLEIHRNVVTKDQCCILRANIISSERSVSV